MTIGNETGRQGDEGETGRQEEENPLVPSPPHLPVPPSPPLLLSHSLILRRLWEKIFADEVFGRAAQLAYYWLFSLFPLLIFLTALLAYVPLPHFFEDLFAYLQNVLPRDAFAMLDTTFTQIRTQPSSGLLSFGILLSIWVSSSGMEAIISALNTAYDVPNRRAWWQERLLAIVLICGLAFSIILALALLFFGGSWG